MCPGGHEEDLGTPFVAELERATKSVFKNGIRKNQSGTEKDLWLFAGEGIEIVPNGVIAGNRCRRKFFLYSNLLPRFTLKAVVESTAMLCISAEPWFFR